MDEWKEERKLPSEEVKDIWGSRKLSTQWRHTRKLTNPFIASDIETALPRTGLDRRKRKKAVLHTHTER
jgi:hypothetical protein